MNFLEIRFWDKQTYLILFRWFDFWTRVLWAAEANKKGVGDFLRGNWTFIRARKDAEAARKE